MIAAKTWTENVCFNSLTIRLASTAQPVSAS